MHIAQNANQTKPLINMDLKSAAQPSGAVLSVGRAERRIAFLAESLSVTIVCQKSPTASCAVRSKSIMRAKQTDAPISSSKLPEAHEGSLQTPRKTWACDYLDTMSRPFDMCLNWDVWFDILRKQRQAIGPDRCIRATGPQADRLAGFIRYCRRSAARGMLGKGKIEQLNDIGFEWDAFEAAWREKFENLLSWKESHGTFVVKARQEPSLSQWIRTQRHLYNCGQLAPLREKMLSEVGFSFRPRSDSAWELRFQELLQVKEKLGYIPSLYELSTNKQLFTWISRQRLAYQKGRLSKKRVSRLSEIGFTWQQHDDTWNTYLQDLIIFKKEHGHCSIPQSTKLGQWVHKQRVGFINRKLNQSRIHALENIGFVWNTREARWRQNYAELQRNLKNRHEPTSTNNFSETYLAKWICNQRQAYRRGSLSPERASLLRDSGVLGPKGCSRNIVN